MATAVFALEPDAGLADEAVSGRVAVIVSERDKAAFAATFSVHVTRASLCLAADIPNSGLCHFHAGVKFRRHVSGGKMGALSMVIAVPLAVSARWLTWANNGLRAAVGVVAIAIGATTIHATAFT